MYGLNCDRDIFSIWKYFTHYCCIQNRAFDKNEGGFLYDIALNESIESVAFDEMDNKLYGVDSNDSVYRYDMSELL